MVFMMVFVMMLMVLFMMLMLIVIIHIVVMMMAGIFYFLNPGSRSSRAVEIEETGIQYLLKRHVTIVGLDDFSGGLYSSYDRLDFGQLFCTHFSGFV